MEKSKNKNLTAFLPVIAVLIAVALALCACSDAGAPKYEISPEYPSGLSEDNYIATLESFLDGNEDRTTFGKGEQLAAEYIQKRLSSYGYANSEIIDFSATLSDGGKVDSRHVRAVYQSSSHTSETANVIIAAAYDNRYSSPYTDVSGTRTNGALSDGTSIAALLTLAQYFKTQNVALDYDITFVFFGGTFYDGETAPIGANRYLKEVMTENDRKNTVLMIELQRLGVDHVYAFTDMRETERGKLFDAVAEQYKLDIYKTTSKAAALPAQVLNGVPYAQWSMDGAYVDYFNRGIPTLNIIGANYEGLNLADAESSSNSNIGGTEKDTLDNLKKLYPDYSKKAMTAMSYIVYGLTDPGFLDAVTYDKENFPETDVLTQNWIWPLIVAGFVIIVYALSVLIKFLIQKKHPVVVEQPKQVKMAVFGMDYENKDDNSVYVDLKQGEENDEEIFPGIPNNDRRTTVVMNTAKLNEIFSDMMEDITKDMDEMMARPAQHDPQDNTVDQEQGPQSTVNVEAEDVRADTPTDEKSDAQEKPETPDIIEPSENLEPLKDGKFEKGEKGEKIEKVEKAEGKAKAPKTTAKTTAAKTSTRKTVSAKKSASAPKSATAKKSDGTEEEGQDKDKQ